MNNLHFEYPYLLLTLPILLVCLFRCPQKSDSILFSNINFLKKSSRKFSFLELLKVVTILFLTLSLSSPYIDKIYTKNINISKSEVVAVDISGSMKDSFNNIKTILSSYLNGSQNRVVSLVYFADSLALASPLTDNISFLQKSLQNIKVGDLGEMETKLYDAIVVSQKLLKNAKTEDRYITILTDGIDKGSYTSLNSLLSSVEDENITINTVGFGEDYNEEVLKTISKKSGGTFEKAKDIEELKKLFLDKNKNYIKKKKSYTKKVQLFQLPLFVSFLSLLLFIYLLNRRVVV